MPLLGRRSIGELQSCRDELIVLFSDVVREYDCTIIQGHRTMEEQKENFRNGSTTTLASKHLSFPSDAVDVSPYPIPDNWGEDNFKEKAKFYHFAGYVKARAESLSIKVKWGGDWDGDKDFDDQTFDDLIHWEIIG